MVIKVQLRDSQTGSETTFEFDQSPIRIGRNALNDLVIEDRFVSQWHGMIRFDDTGVTFFDLGSTNGTRFEGKRLTKNTAFSLRGPAPLGISRFELRVTAAPGAQDSTSIRIALHAEIFGVEFARAYASVALGSADPPSHSDG
jgi:pSer/pThr/pTyr-binding forkhead associated (FHA) protein